MKIELSYNKNFLSKNPLCNKQKSKIQSFKSKVVWEYPNNSLSSNEKDEIDNFEEYYWRYRKLGEGKCASVYELFPNNFVIKKIENKYREFDNFSSEAQILNKIPTTFVNSQQLKAQVKTEKGNYYLISTLKKGSSINIHNNPLSSSKIEGVLDSLLKLDKALIYHQDLNNNNILLDGTNANIIDYQWAKTFIPDYRYTNESNGIFFPQDTIPSNAQHYETAGFASYLHKYYSIYGYSQTRNFLKDYLTKKSEYHHQRYRFFKDYLTKNYTINSNMENALKFERALNKVYEDPNEDVLDVELMRMDFLRSHKKSYSFVDPNMEKNVNMFNALPYIANTVLSLKNFSYNLDKLSIKYNDDKYMRRYIRYNKKIANYWKEKLEKWYPDTIDYLKRLSKQDLTEKQIYDSNNNLRIYTFKNFSPIMRTEFERKNIDYYSSSNILPNSNDVTQLRNLIQDILNIDGLETCTVIFSNGRGKLSIETIRNNLREMYNQFNNCCNNNRPIDAFCIILTMRNCYADIANINPNGIAPIIELNRVIDNKAIIFDNIINTMWDNLIKTLSYDKPIYDNGNDFKLTEVNKYQPPQNYYNTTSSNNNKKDIFDKIADWWNNL